MARNGDSQIPIWTLADRLRKIRRDRHLTQKQFAEAIGVKSATYEGWESGRNTPEHPLELAARIELTFGVPALWTLGFPGVNGSLPPPHPQPPPDSHGARMALK